MIVSVLTENKRKRRKEANETSQFSQNNLGLSRVLTTGVND